MVYYKFNYPVKGRRQVHLFEKSMQVVDGIITLEEEPSPRVRIGLRMRGYRLMAVPPEKRTASPQASEPAPSAHPEAEEPQDAPSGTGEASEAAPEAQEDKSGPAKDAKPQKAPKGKANKPSQKR